MYATATRNEMALRLVVVVSVGPRAVPIGMSGEVTLHATAHSYWVKLILALLLGVGTSAWLRFLRCRKACPVAAINLFAHNTFNQETDPSAQLHVKTDTEWYMRLLTCAPYKFVQSPFPEGRVRDSHVLRAKELLG
jgi:hypothetical protein